MSLQRGESSVGQSSKTGRSGSAHNEPVDHAHFHEVGAGRHRRRRRCCDLFELLSIESFRQLAASCRSGTVTMAHGRFLYRRVVVELLKGARLTQPILRANW